jgi:basic membrane lipoprotein Med (substrate-binding protein (PBP1-ABC) superfamily)
MGVAAGKLAPNGKIGYIGAFPTATLFNDVNGLLLGARSVNPKATVQTVLVNTFFDPQKAAQAADALLNDGVEFLFGVMDEPTYLQKAESKGVWTGYWNLDQSKAAPTKYVNNFNLTSWEGFYTSQFNALLDGSWVAPTKPVLLDCPLDKWGPQVPKDVQDAVAAAQAKLASGELSVYTGPLKDNKGKEVLAAGKKLDSQGAYETNFAVEGVSGV